MGSERVAKEKSPCQFRPAAASSESEVKAVRRAAPLSVMRVNGTSKTPTISAQVDPRYTPRDLSLDVCRAAGAHVPPNPRRDAGGPREARVCPSEPCERVRAGERERGDPRDFFWMRDYARELGRLAELSEDEFRREVFKRRNLR